MLPTHVGAVNLSQFKYKEIDEFRYWGKPIALNDWCTVSISGPDTFDWFQRQLAQNISEINNIGMPVVRLDRTAKVIYFGILAKVENTFNLFIPKALVQNFKDDFEKFVIMEETHIDEVISSDLSFVIGPSKDGVYVDFFGEQGSIFFQKTSETESTKAYMSLAGHPVWEQNVTGTELVNETRLNDVAVDYNKGCFLGQETAAKVQTRRGANYFPVALKINARDISLGDININDNKAGSLQLAYLQDEDKVIAIGKLKRDYRIYGATHEITVASKKYNATVEQLPYFSDLSNDKKAQTLYMRAIKDFENNYESEAIKKLERAIEFNPLYSDAFEVMGVIYARNGKHQKTIDWMDKLLESDPKSVMAHTNKSLAYMNLGEIEKAEDEKALATTKSFAMYGAEAKSKKELAEAAKKEELEIKRREEMFVQVLAIDENDQIALFGMADIKFKRNDFSESLLYLDKSLSANQKHSQSYLLKGKCLEALNRKDDAKDVYSSGIKIAAAQGELMPANDMQSRLNRLLND